MRVNIIGFGFGCKQTPIDGEHGPVWGVNDTILHRPVDLLFDMHDLPEFLSGGMKFKRRTVAILKAELEEVRKTGTKMYSLRYWPELPCSAYPIERVTERFPAGANFFTGTVDYAVAFALLEGYTDIRLYGLNFSGGYEYNKQRPGIHYWVGVADGMGARVVTQPQHSSLMKTHDGLVYGYNIKQGEFLKRIADSTEYVKNLCVDS